MFIGRGRELGVLDRFIYLISLDLWSSMGVVWGKLRSLINL